ncbi:tetratricopeptide repeat protein [Acinetobacter lwoffii]|uniref:tetratricopeptide repeat protein n=1 Tax=Acinetobacter lwoffii TaxID=28090 RepID=UPI001FB2F063|nr:tetratricopeptide repeat protein [Acinetobacter lwoffii]
MYLWIITIMMKTCLPIITLYLFLLLCFLLYIVGLDGNFLFDDYPNLKPLGTYGTINNWDKVRAFVSSGFAGPTGRPISLASFLIDANTWPTSPYPFKYTNLLIHLLNGVLLCWAILLLLKNYAYKEQKAVWIAILATACWLLHPYMVSTTLYIVQRMAQLATLFSLVGIIGYLKARQALATRPIIAYLGMMIAIGAGTILATYSKENGALLPLLILVIEFCNPNKIHKPIWQWRAICLWLPSLAVLCLIFRELNFSEHLWPNRNFNQVERLFSEARIVTEYLYNLYIPQIELKGLYQDGYNISKGLLQPISTLGSILFLAALSLSAFIARKKFPLFSVAILFFFAAHLMESTVLGLELYFEHRNYLAALFLFLPIASGLYLLQEKMNPKLVILITLVIFSILSFFTYERAKLWGKTAELEIYWAKISPNSPRAQNAIAGVLMNQGRVQEANHFLEQAMQRMPDSALLNLQLLLQKVYAQIATEQDFIDTAQRLQKQPFDAQAVKAIRVLTEYVSEHQIHAYTDLSLELIQEMDHNPQYHQFSVYQRVSPYLKAKLYLVKKQPDDALAQYLIALPRYNDVEAGMMMVAEIGSAGYTTQALTLLEKTKVVYQHQTKFQRTKREYDFEVQRVEEILKEQLQEKSTLSPKNG